MSPSMTALRRPTQSAPEIAAPKNSDGSLLRVENLRVEFRTPAGPVPAVDGVTFDLAPGEILGIVGESGSGKSVALSSIVGLTRGEASGISGSAHFGGLDLITASEKELRKVRGRDIGMVFQNPMTSLNPVRTIGTQLAEAISLHYKGLSRSELKDRVIAALRQVGVPAAEKRLGQYAHEFSGGMQQRAMIAMALVNSPRLVIADEPTTALDVTIQAQVLDLLVQARDELGASIIIVTHDLGVLAEIADRIVVMYAGRMVESGSVYDIFDRPRHPYTERLQACLPSLETPRKRLLTVAGQAPVLGARPSGCAFHPRCFLASDICFTEDPASTTVGDGHVASCHHSDLMAAHVKEDL
ncbi:MAG: transporter ATP-binding protein [Pseudonocardiales bacterium]|nr:transporter ATP-binding protein [Pseudonocardiales bacterium]